MNKAVVALALTTLTFGSASAYLMRELSSEREQSQILQAKLEKLSHTPPVKPSNPFEPPAFTAPPPAPAAEPPRPTPPVPAMVREPAAAALSTEAPAFPGGREAMIERTQRLLQDPEYRKAMLAQQKFSLSRMHSDLQSALRLQPEEADRLLELLAEQQLNQMANRPPFRRDGPPDQYEMQKYQEQMQQLQREREAQIASLLGDSKLQEWQNYQKTLGARTQIRELRTALAESGMPLREGQVEPLVAAIASEQERRTQDVMKGRATLTATGPMTRAARVEFIEQDLERVAEYNQRLHDAAAPYLSIDQLRQFDRHLEQQLEMQRANLQLMRAQQDAAARGDVASPYGEVAVQSTSGFVAIESVGPH